MCKTWPNLNYWWFSQIVAIMRNWLGFVNYSRQRTRTAGSSHREGHIAVIRINSVSRKLRNLLTGTYTGTTARELVKCKYAELCKCKFKLRLPFFNRWWKNSSRSIDPHKSNDKLECTHNLDGQPGNTRHGVTVTHTFGYAYNCDVSDGIQINHFVSFVAGAAWVVDIFSHHAFLRTEGPNGGTSVSESVLICMTVGCLWLPVPIFDGKLL